MKYLVLERETSVEEIAGKAYRNLPAAERRKAEKALIKENPRLKNMANVRAGALIRIPEGPRAERLDRRNVVDPVADLADKVADQLGLFEDELRRHFKARDEEVSGYPEIIKAAGKEEKKQPEIKEVSADLVKHLRASKKSNRQNRDRTLEAMKQLQEVAAALARR
jgi:hypothetical protein